MREVQKGVCEGKHEDAVLVAMKELERSKGKTLRSSEWAQDEGLWRFRDRIYVPMIPDLHRRIVKQHHDSKIAGHAGRWKTLELVCGATGGLTCHDTSDNTVRHATCVFAQRHRNKNHSVSFTPFLFLKHDGML